MWMTMSRAGNCAPGAIQMTVEAWMRERMATKSVKVVLAAPSLVPREMRTLDAERLARAKRWRHAELVMPFWAKWEHSGA